VYHTAGFRVTSDGTTAAACGYVDGVFKTCGTIPGVTANQFTDRQFGILINGIGCNYSAGDNTCQNAVIQDVHGCTDGSGAICITTVSAPGTWNAGKLFVEPAAGAYVRITGVTGVTQANGVWTVNITNSNTNEWRLNNSTWPGSGAVAQTAALFNNFVQTDMYVKSYRVWSCANWKTTQCNGPVLTTSP